MSVAEDRLTPRIASGLSTVRSWESDPSLLREVRDSVPLGELITEEERRAVAAIASSCDVAEGAAAAAAASFPRHISLPTAPSRASAEDQADGQKSEESKSDSSKYARPDDHRYSGDDLLLRRLALYFQRDVMTWVNNPPCKICGETGTTNAGMRGPVTEEEREGGAGRVELYHCPKCQSQTTTFPRYNSPRTLFRTRQGRCGEYANLFGLYCRSLGYETRYVSDFTDHVWVEVWSNARSTWIHADGCEGTIDEPSMYEHGWGKDLNVILGFTVDGGVLDITGRYTRKLNTAEFQARRRAALGGMAEAHAEMVIAQVNATVRAGNANVLSKARVDELDRRTAEERRFFGEAQRDGTWGDGGAYGEGRLSGSLAWRAARNELGPGGGGGGGAGANLAGEDESDGADADGGDAASPPPEERGRFFHVESYHPRPRPVGEGGNISSSGGSSNDDDGDDVPLSITVATPPPSLPPSVQAYPRSIVVSGVPCAAGLPGSISAVVVDDGSSASGGAGGGGGGCILQSRSFRSWADAAAFLGTVPDGRIVALCADTADEMDGGDTRDGLACARLGVLSEWAAAAPSSDANGSSNEDMKGKEYVLYVGQVNHRPSWTEFHRTTAPMAINVTVRLPPGPGTEQEPPKLRLRTELDTVPSMVGTRLPEDVMPLRTQLLATESQKRTAFLKFIEENGGGPDAAAARRAYYSGYVTREGAPVYLFSGTGFPLQRCGDTSSKSNVGKATSSSSSSRSWTTYHYLPGPLVSEGDNVVEDGNNKAAAIPKFDVPLDTGFFTNLLGHNLLVKDANGNPTSIDTQSSLHNSRLVALYFSAHWCGPCRRFTPMLCEFYAHMKEEVLPTHGLEIVFVSSDRDPHSFRQYYDTMPWMAVPFESRFLQQTISQRYGVRGIPALVVLDSISGQVVVTADQSRSEVMRACQGGDDAISDLVSNGWLGRIPPESSAIMESLEMSCLDDDDGNCGDEDQNPYLVRATATSEDEQHKKDPSERVKEIFASLVAAGTEPNAAAAKAIQIVAEEQAKNANTINLSAGDLDDVPWKSILCLPAAQSSANANESAIVTFNDANTTTCTNKTHAIRILPRHDTDSIVGIECVSGDDESVKHMLPSTTAAKSKNKEEDWCDAECPFYEGSETDIRKVYVKMGSGGIKDLKLITSQNPSTKGGEADLALEVPNGYHLTGLHGTMSDGGMTALGLVCSKKWRVEEVRAVGEGKGSLTSTSLRVAASNVALLNPTANEAVREVISTAKQYLDNAQKEPWTSKFRHFKLSNKFCDRIVRVPGGIDLLLRLGFSMYNTDVDFVACIPLASDLAEMQNAMSEVLADLAEN